MKAYEVAISGSYLLANKDIVSYDKIKGVMPALDEDKLTQMAIKRYAPMWLASATNSKGEPLPRVHKVREVFIDSVDDAEGEFTFVGKDIMEMSPEEIQDLAAAKDLAGIPLFRAGSLAQARRVAFSEYAIKVLGMTQKLPNGRYEMDWRLEGYNPANYEPIVADGKIRREDGKPADIEESIDRETLALNKKAKPITEGAGDTESRLTLEQLKEIANTKKISFPPGIKYNELYKKIYGKAA